MDYTSQHYTMHFDSIMKALKSIFLDNTFGFVALVLFYILYYGCSRQLVKQVLIQEPRPHQPQVVVWVSSTKHDFSLIEEALSPFTELLVTTKIWVPLLHPFGYCAMLIIVVICKHHRWAGLLVTTLPWRFGWHLLCYESRPLTQLIKIKKQTTKNNRIRSEQGSITTDIKEIQNILKEYFKKS